MGVTAGRELQLALTGALRLARGDRRGLACFDASLDGFWRSFRAAVLCFPLYVMLLMLHVSAGAWSRTGAFRVFAVETIAYVITWVAFPLLVLPMTRWLDREARFFRYMVAYNWCQLPETFVFALVGLEEAARVLPAAAAHAVAALAAGATLLYEWYIARAALEVTGIAAATIVLVNLVLAVLVSRVASSLY